MDIVVAHYNESLKWLAQLPASDSGRRFIYNKGEMLPDRGDGWEIIPRPNIGREAETYLYHIITNYDSLADWTLFLQGAPLDHSRDLHLGEHAARGFVPLAPRRTVVEHYDAVLRPETFYLPVFKKLEHLGLGGAPRVQIEFPAGAQFAVSGESIRARPKAFYEELIRQINIGPEFSQFNCDYYRRADYNHERIDAWILERLWGLIFGLPSASSF